MDPKAQASPEGDLKLQEILNHNVGKLTAWLGRRQKIAHQIFGGRGGFRVGLKNVFQMSLRFGVWIVCFWGPNTSSPAVWKTRVCLEFRFEATHHHNRANTPEV